MIRSQGGPGIIPTFSNTQAAQSARVQVASLGNTKWPQELSRPITMELSQPETTTTTQQQHTTSILKAGPPIEPDSRNQRNGTERIMPTERRRRSEGSEQVHRARRSADDHPTTRATQSPLSGTTGGRPQGSGSGGTVKAETRPAPTEEDRVQEEAAATNRATSGPLGSAHPLNCNRPPVRPPTRLLDRKLAARRISEAKNLDRTQQKMTSIQCLAWALILRWPKIILCYLLFIVRKLSIQNFFQNKIILG